MTKLTCINNKPLPGNDVAPPLEIGKTYDLIKTVKDSGGFKHYDVGLISKHNFISSWDVKEEELPNSAKGGIHWCHPSRFTQN